MNTNFKTVDEQEIHRFSQVSSGWWDENGPFRPLHLLNPTRLRFIRNSLEQHFSCSTSSTTPFTGLKILDIGCGGGLVAEPLSRLGAKVTGIDASEKTIDVAKKHAQIMGLDICYRCASAETLLDEGLEFDVVLGLEIVEHVSDIPAFIEICTTLTNAQGALLLSTLNRTWKAWLTAIIGAEYILRWLPKGTHEWEKFVTPAELANHLRSFNFNVCRMNGLSFHPLSQEWSLTNDLDINYLLWASRFTTEKK